MDIYKLLNTMKKQICYIILIGFISVINIYAQNPTHIFYNQHKNLVNPAATGQEKGHTISVDIRNQWQGDTEAPQSQTLLTTHRINERVSVGFSIQNNKVFIQKQAGLYADFAYAIPINEYSKLYGGLKFGGDFFNIDGSRIRTYTSPHNTYYDPYLQTISGKFQINIGTGVYYEHRDFYVGLSVPNLLASEEVKVKEDVMTSVAQRFHIYGLAGYFWKLSPEFTLKPMLQTRFVKDVSPSFDLTLAGVYLKNSELGLTYRTDKAFNAYIMFHIPKYYVVVGYGYENNSQPQLNIYARSSHEFLVQFKW